MSRPRLLGRVGRNSARHPIITIAVWVVLLGVATATAIFGLGGQTLFDRLDSGGDWSNGESATADDLLAGGSDNTVTLLIHGVDPHDARMAAITTTLASDLATIPNVSVVDPLLVPALPDGSVDPRVAPLFADDGRGILFTATAKADPDGTVPQGTVDQIVARMGTAADDIRTAHPDATAVVGSTQLLVDSIVSISENDLRRGETVALPIALLVMLVVFGGFLAAGMPLVGAIVSILGGLGALFGFTYLLDVNTTVVNVVTAVGLGLSIDYGLLIVSRFREEYRAAAAGSPPNTAGDRRVLRLTAITAATDRAGRTVAYSGTVFAIASLGLLVFDPSIVKAIGLGALAVTLVSIASALTLLPALLSVTGQWIVRPGLVTRIPGVGPALTRFGDVAPTEGFFSRLTRRVQKHPAAVTFACVAVLLLLASPLLGLRLANTSVDAIPRSSTQYTFVSSLNAHFPAAASQRVVIVTDTAAHAASWSADVAKLDHVVSVSAAQQVNQVWKANVRVDTNEGGAVVRAIRSDRPDFPNWVTGADARTADFANSLARGVPWAVLVIAIGTIALLFLMTGSLVIPLKALVASALSLGASIGLLVWGFQDAGFAGLMGFNPNDVHGVDVIVVLLTIVFGFGLAMDYEMFLLSRVTELHVAGVPTTDAIALGLQRSGRIITSAALIIIVVFAGFATGDLMIIKQLGVALAFAVFLDATLVRCLLVPAFMTWQRRILWWAPGWMRSIHVRFALSE